MVMVMMWELELRWYEAGKDFVGRSDRGFSKMLCNIYHICRREQKGKRERTKVIEDKGAEEAYTTGPPKRMTIVAKIITIPIRFAYRLQPLASLASRSICALINPHSFLISSSSNPL